ncbi:MAG: hypothetical protein JXA10_13040 [Anaerolineae bacterium]|nr:hypothetical protein [Anaerolineae bacterium]
MIDTAHGISDLPPRAVRGTVILISGARQIGKTTVLCHVRETALQTGYSVGGFLSVARFAADETGAEAKTGIDLMDAATGARLPLATIGGDGPVQTGHYTFNPAALEAGLVYAQAGQGADVFFVDELGPLELKRGAGWVAVLGMIRARQFGVALMTMRPELLDLARERMHLPPAAPLITITAANREQIAHQLAAWVKGAIAK